MGLGVVVEVGAAIAFDADAVVGTDLPGTVVIGSGQGVPRFGTPSAGLAAR
jgi:hypothetical protein